MLGTVGRIASVALVGLMLAACSSTTEAPQVVSKGKIDPRYGVAPSPRVVGENDPVPQGGGRYMTGKPYRIGARWFTPMENPVGYEAVGMASWYGRNFHGRRTANGEVFDAEALTAAHPTLPLPCYIRITNLDNGRSMTVRVNDRGPYHGRRLIDVSHDTAHMLGFKTAGTARVKIQYVGPASLKGSDRNILLASYRGPTDMRPAPTTPAGAREVLIASADKRPADFGWGSAGKPSLPGVDLSRNRAVDPQSQRVLPGTYPTAAAPVAKKRAPAPVVPQSVTIASALPSAPVPQARPGADNAMPETDDGFYLTANAAERAAEGGLGQVVEATGTETVAAVDLSAPMPRANPKGMHPSSMPTAFAPPAAAHAPAEDAIADIIGTGSVPVSESAPRGNIPFGFAEPAPAASAPVPHPAPVNSYAAAPASRFDAIEQLLSADAGPGAASVSFSKKPAH
ncbi:septal ring lytic transglycosylase RlpA family protein [Segnochrobactraceae bacterium EtOH-i3]